MSILDLPPELFVQILTNLDYRNILICCSVCKDFNSTIRSSQKLLYKVELVFDGMIDLPIHRKHLSTGEKLQLLLDRRNAWRRLEWKRKLRVPMSGSCKAYELVSGVFAKSTATGSSLGSRHFVMAKLPSSHDEGAGIVRQDVGVASKDFVIDPTQDLIGYISEHGFFPHSEIQIHLRTISTDKPHPDARKPIIHHICALPFVMINSFVAVADDVIAIFFWVDSPGLIIWNWKTSDMLVYVTDHLHLPDEVWDFSFLSNRAFILTGRSGNGSIEIYSFDSIPNKLTLHHVASLELPLLQEGIQLALFSTHSGPFTTVPKKEYQQTFMNDDKPFTCAPESRVHAMCVQYHMGRAGNLERGSRFYLFVKNDYLLKFVDEYKQKCAVGKKTCTDGEGVTKKPAWRLCWTEWGPQNTRFMAYGMQFKWLRYVHGQKVVCPPYTAGQGGKRISVLEVLDFNVHVKRLPPEISFANIPDPENPDKVSDTCVLYVQTGPSSIVKPEIFLDPVVSRLPYTRSIRMHMGEMYSGFMIDEERIVGLRLESSPEGEMGDIDVFTF